MVAAAVTLVLLGAGTPSLAATYFFKPGHPMLFGSSSSPTHRCTGGYAVRGASGMFVVTAGHCSTNAARQGVTGAVVYGATRRFGTIIRNDHVGDFYNTNTFDGALVRLDPGDDALQIVVDPVTGRSPGDGRVRGWYANSALTRGFVIGKMGIASGWTEGAITAWQTVVDNRTGWRYYLLCSNVPILPGDSGGPVWRWDSNGIMAIGIAVFRLDAGGFMCFNPIQNVLNRFGAWLPVYTTAARGGTAQPMVITEPQGPPVPVDPNPAKGQLL